MNNKQRRYTPEFKREAVELALNSPSVLSAAADLGIPEATLHSWVQKARRSGEAIHPNTDKPVNVGKLVEENLELKRGISPIAKT